MAASQLAPGLNEPAEAVPEPSAYVPLQPGDPRYFPSTNPETVEDWENTTRDSLQRMLDYEESRKDWYAKTARAPIEIDGVPQKTIAVKGVTNAKGESLIVGYITPDDRIVPVDPNPATKEEADAIVAEIVANAAEAEEGWGAEADAAVPAPDSAGPASGKTLAGVSVPAPTGTGGGSSRSSGGGGYPRSSGGGYPRSSGGGYSSGWRDDGGDDEGGFTADDFMDAANGNRRVAEMMARNANRKRRKRGGGAFWEGFPFNRPPSPTRANILASLSEAFAEAFPNRRR